MKILTVSDIESSLIYSPHIRERFNHVDLAISCGDLSYFYLEYIISTLDVPLYYVRGNHARDIEYSHRCTRTEPWGAVNLHRKVIRDKTTGLLLAGIQGCNRYNHGKYQYTQQEMWLMIMTLVPRLLLNKIRFGKFLDIFVTHAPSWGIHDEEDCAHRGIKAFLWIDKVFQPTYHLHGHVHIYWPSTVSETTLGKTLVFNTYGYRKFDFQLPSERQPVLD